MGEKLCPECHIDLPDKFCEECGQLRDDGEIYTIDGEQVCTYCLAKKAEKKK